MYRIISLVLCFILLFSLCACTEKSTPSTKETKKTEDTEITSDTTEVEETEAPCEHVYEEEVQKEPTYGINGYKIKYCTKCDEMEFIEIPALESIFELKVTNKSVMKMDNTGYVGFDIVVENISDKKIESFSGSLSILTSDCLLTLMCDFEDISLEPYSTITLDSYGYTFEFGNEDEAAEETVYETNFEDMNINFSLSKISVTE